MQTWVQATPSETRDGAALPSSSPLILWRARAFARVFVVNVARRRRDRPRARNVLNLSAAAAATPHLRASHRVAAMRLKDFADGALDGALVAPSAPRPGVDMPASRRRSGIRAGDAVDYLHRIGRTVRGCVRSRGRGRFRGRLDGDVATPTAMRDLGESIESAFRRATLSPSCLPKYGDSRRGVEPCSPSSMEGSRRSRRRRFDRASTPAEAHIGPRATRARAATPSLARRRARSLDRRIGTMRRPNRARASRCIGARDRIRREGRRRSWELCRAIRARDAPASRLARAEETAGIPFGFGCFSVSARAEIGSATRLEGEMLSRQKCGDPEGRVGERRGVRRRRTPRGSTAMTSGRWDGRRPRRRLEEADTDERVERSMRRSARASTTSTRGGSDADAEVVVREFRRRGARGTMERCDRRTSQSHAIVDGIRRGGRGGDEGEAPNGLWRRCDGYFGGGGDGGRRRRPRREADGVRPPRPRRRSICGDRGRRSGSTAIRCRAGAPERAAARAVDLDEAAALDRASLCRRRDARTLCRRAFGAAKYARAMTAQVARSTERDPTRVMFAARAADLDVASRSSRACSSPSMRTLFVDGPGRRRRRSEVDGARDHASSASPIDADVSTMIVARGVAARARPPARTRWDDRGVGSARRPCRREDAQHPRVRSFAKEPVRRRDDARRRIRGETPAVSSSRDARG